jgi:hypothetical protein
MISPFLKFLNFIYLPVFALLSACGASTDTISGKDLTPETVLGSKADGSDSKIYGSYRIQFDDETKKFESSVTFRVGGKTGTGLKLVEPDHIELQNERLGERPGDSNIYTTFYSIEKSIPAPEEKYTFQWFQGSVVRTNSIPMHTVQSELPESITVDRSNDLVIPWKGDVLATNETIEVHVEIQDEYDATSTHDWHTRVNAGSSVVMPQNVILAFQNGQAFLQITRESTDSPAEGHGAGGILISRYKSKKTTLVFP